MQLVFEWDEAKAKQNVRKHGISFEEAKTVFGDPFAITMPDPDHSEHERRYTDLGMSVKGRVLVVVYTERGEAIRIVSCRRATRTERDTYEQE